MPYSGTNRCGGTPRWHTLYLVRDVADVPERNRARRRSVRTAVRGRQEPSADLGAGCCCVGRMPSSYRPHHTDREVRGERASSPDGSTGQPRRAYCPSRVVAAREDGDMLVDRYHLDALTAPCRRGDLRAWRTPAGGRASCADAGIRVFSASRDLLPGGALPGQWTHSWSTRTGQ